MRELFSCKANGERHSSEPGSVWLHFRSALCEPGWNSCNIQSSWKSADTAWHCWGAVPAAPSAAAIPSAPAAGPTIAAPDGRIIGLSGEELAGRREQKGWKVRAAQASVSKSSRRHDVLCSLPTHRVFRENLSEYNHCLTQYYELIPSASKCLLSESRYKEKQMQFFRSKSCLM